MDQVKTTEEVNADYKTRAPKFDEKIHQDDTEDWVAWSARRKPLTVGLPPILILFQMGFMTQYAVYASYKCCTVLVLCLYYA